jgi:hypothetical protein
MHESGGTKNRLPSDLTRIYCIIGGAFTHGDVAALMMIVVGPREHASAAKGALAPRLLL